MSLVRSHLRLVVDQMLTLIVPANVLVLLHNVGMLSLVCRSSAERDFHGQIRLRLLLEIKISQAVVFLCDKAASHQFGPVLEIVIWLEVGIPGWGSVLLQTILIVVKSKCLIFD